MKKIIDFTFIKQRENYQSIKTTILGEYLKIQCKKYIENINDQVNRNTSFLLRDQVNRNGGSNIKFK